VSVGTLHIAQRLQVHALGVESGASSMPS
jgi:hypothetical protein